MNTKQFLDGLAGTDILALDELAKMRRHLSPEQLVAAPDALARELVRRRKLTRYQVMQVVQGNGRSLTFGEYVVLDKIGEGGMGQVFKAEHRRMKRLVALKVLPAHTTGSSSLVDRFYKEVELAARLTHPNIVAAYDAGEAHGLHYLVMEYIDGHTLSDHIKANGPLSVEQAMNCVLQAARGLDYAHAEGIVHRDVKPSNLMVNQRGVVKILDLGLARVQHSLAAPLAAGYAELTTSGQVLGTVDYMAPEQSYDSRAADHRSDIYSLGCTLYRLLTGHPPYEGDTMMQKLLAHREHSIPSLREERGDVPAALDIFYHRMVAKLPDDRPRSMREVVAALESFMANTSDAESTVSHMPVTNSEDDGLDSFLQRMAGSSGIGLGASHFSETPAPGSSGTIRSGSGSVSRARRKKTQAAVGWLMAAAAGIAVMLGLGSWLSNRTHSGDKKTAAAAKPTEKKKSTRTKNRLVEAVPNAPAAAAPPTTLIDTASSPGSGANAGQASPADATAPQQPVDPQMPMPEAPVIAQAPTETTDLLQKIDNGASTGAFTIDGNGLAAPGGATLRFDVKAPEEYDLTAVVDNAKLDGTCQLGLPVQSRTTTFTFARNAKPTWSLEAPPPGWSAERAVTLPEGPMTIVCAVRKDRVHVAFDGRTALDWPPQGSAPALQSNLVGADGRLCLSLQANYRLTSLQMGAPSAKLPRYRAIDLLADADAARDRASGAVRVERGDLMLETTADPLGSCISFTGERPTEYVLTALVERSGGADQFCLALPTGRSRAGAAVDLVDGSAQLSGIGTFATQPHTLLLTPWRLHTVVYTVRGDHLLRVEVDGREIIRFEQVFQDDWLLVAQGVRDPAAFFVRGSPTSSFRIRRLDLTPLDWRKLPQPSAEALAAALEAIEPTVAAARNQAAKGDDRLPAARTLRIKASGSDDPARRWALLDAAGQQAATDGDLILTCHIAADLARTFEGDLKAWYERVIPAAFRGVKTTTARQALVIEALRQIDAAVALDAFDLAQTLQAATASVKSLPADVQREVKARGAEIEFLREVSAAGGKALAALAKDPASTEAHLAAGRYLAVVSGDWSAAAAHFKQGGDEELAHLASREALPNDEKEQPAADSMALGDRWWALSTKAAAPLKWWYMERAAGWYRRALPISTSKIKTAIESKMKLLARQRKTSADAFRQRHPIDAMSIAGRWYKYYPAAVSWKKAESICRGLGGSLPIIKTLADNDALVKAVAAGEAPSERRSCWLGCSDEAKEGTWRWLDGTPVGLPGFLNWRAGQPDNGEGVEDFGAMLLLFEKGEFKTEWTDERETPLPFVCVWED